MVVSPGPDLSIGTVVSFTVPKSDVHQYEWLTDTCALARRGVITDVLYANPFVPFHRYEIQDDDTDEWVVLTLDKIQKVQGARRRVVRDPRAVVLAPTLPP